MTSKEDRQESRSFFDLSYVYMARKENDARIAYAALDISDNGLGIMVKDELIKGEIVRLTAYEDELSLEVAWCEADRIKDGMFHAGLKLLSEERSVIAFYDRAKSKHEQQAKTSISSGEDPTANPLPFSELQKVLSTVNTDDPMLLVNAGFDILVQTHKAYPFVHDDDSYVTISPRTIPLSELRKIDLKKAVQNIAVFNLKPESTGKRSWNKVWPTSDDVAKLPREKILIIEDDEDVRMMIRTLLEANNFDVIEAENGKEGFVKCITSSDVGLVITDLKMPELDGLNMIDKVNVIAGAKRQRIPILVVSGYVTQSDLARGKELGVKNWLVKPFDEKDLITNVNELLQRPTKLAV